MTALTGALLGLGIFAGFVLVIFGIFYLIRNL
jgi:hypothetical protein